MSDAKPTIEQELDAATQQLVALNERLEKAEAAEKAAHQNTLAIRAEHRKVLADHTMLTIKKLRADRAKAAPKAEAPKPQAPTPAGRK